MRLLVATPLYPPEPGGPATYAKLLEEHLPERGIRVKVIPFSLVRHHLPGIRHVLYAFWLLRYALQADIIFVQDTFSVGFPAVCVAWITRKPVVLRVPGDYAWEQGVQRFGVSEGIDEFQTKRYGLRVETLRAVQRFVASRADLVIAPSKYFGRIVEGWGVDRNTLRVIYNGIDLDIDVEEPSNVPKGRIAITVGRLTPWKGIKKLIELMEEVPDWTLVVVGDGPQRQELKREALALGVAHRVLFVGAVSRSRMYGWCKRADAFLLNSSFESFSFQVVEAMYAGVPVITTNVGSLPELIEDSVEGVLCTPDDMSAFKAALTSTESNKAMWMDRTERAQLKAREFSIENTLNKLESELRKLV